MGSLLVCSTSCFGQVSFVDSCWSLRRERGPEPKPSRQVAETGLRRHPLDPFLRLSKDLVAFVVAPFSCDETIAFADLSS